MKDTKPIKRSPFLAEFSKDHHFGLLLAWKIRQGLKNNIEPERIARYILFYFNNELLSHFVEEEKLLFKKLDEQSELRKQAESDHVAIYQLVVQIMHNRNDDKLIGQFADKLEEHIRFEERELFNYIQACLSEDELTDIAGQFSRQVHDADITWQDEFWVNKN